MNKMAFIVCVGETGQTQRLERVMLIILFLSVYLFKVVKSHKSWTGHWKVGRSFSGRDMINLN